jgi:hypothetical protein
MFNWLLRYLGIDNPHAKAKRAARLSESEALAVARAAAEQSADAESLHFADIVDEQGETIWVFTTASRCSSLVVRIRDRDGAVVRKERVGRR